MGMNGLILSCQLHALGESNAQELSIDEKGILHKVIVFAFHLQQCWHHR